MKNKQYEDRSEFVADVEDLLEKSVFEEAAEAVFKAFDASLSTLDKESKELIESYFDGKTIKQLSEMHKLSESEVSKWLEQIKRQLNQNIRKEHSVRH